MRRCVRVGSALARLGDRRDREAAACDERRIRGARRRVRLRGVAAARAGGVGPVLRARGGAGRAFVEFVIPGQLRVGGNRRQPIGVRRGAGRCRRRRRRWRGAVVVGTGAVLTVAAGVTGRSETESRTAAPRLIARMMTLLPVTVSVKREACRVFRGDMQDARLVPGNEHACELATLVRAQRHHRDVLPGSTHRLRRGHGRRRGGDPRELFAVAVARPVASTAIAVIPATLQRAPERGEGGRDLRFMWAEPYSGAGTTGSGDFYPRVSVRSREATPAARIVACRIGCSSCSLEAANRRDPGKRRMGRGACQGSYEVDAVQDGRRRSSTLNKPGTLRRLVRHVTTLHRPTRRVILRQPCPRLRGRLRGALRGGRDRHAQVIHAPGPRGRDASFASSPARAARDGALEPDRAARQTGPVGSALRDRAAFRQHRDQLRRRTPPIPRAGPCGDSVARGDARVAGLFASSSCMSRDPPAAESALAVGEVELPHALEAAVVAERAHAFELGEEVLPPAAQRPNVVRGDVLELDRAADR